MSLCKGCKYMGDQVAKHKPNPDKYKRELGLLSEMAGHGKAHEFVKSEYQELEGNLDNFMALTA